MPTDVRAAVTSAPSPADGDGSLAEAAPGIRTVRPADPTAIRDAVPQLAQEADFVVADGPAAPTDTRRPRSLRADVAIVSRKASVPEVRAPAPATAARRAAPAAASRTPSSRWARRAAPIDPPKT